jgi:hypothetical protein
MCATESRAAANLAVVGGIYEAFGRGDIDFILDQPEPVALPVPIQGDGQQGRTYGSPAQRPATPAGRTARCQETPLGGLGAAARTTDHAHTGQGVQRGNE